MSIDRFGMSEGEEDLDLELEMVKVVMIRPVLLGTHSLSLSLVTVPTPYNSFILFFSSTIINVWSR